MLNFHQTRPKTIYIIKVNLKQKTYFFFLVNCTVFCYTVHALRRLERKFKYNMCVADILGGGKKGTGWGRGSSEFSLNSSVQSVSWARTVIEFHVSYNF